MTSQAPQRVRRIPSPSTKQGPMKATKTFGLSSSGSRNGVKKISPSTSPTQQWTSECHRKRRSPDHRHSPDRALSPALKDKSRPTASPIKRTGSLDTIVGPYLKGEWPRERAHGVYSTQQTVVAVSSADKQTQTPCEWELDKSRHKRSQSVGAGAADVSKERIKARLAKSSKEQTAWHSLLHSPVHANHYVAAKSIPIHSPRFRTQFGSIEGINQEIEKLSLKLSSGNEELASQTCGTVSTPDGHRAPVQELLDRTRSAITQTPGRTQLHDDTASVRTLDDTITQAIVRIREGEQSVGSSPTSSSSSSSSSSSDNKDDKECESPDPNQFKFIREPPDGAEKVNLKVIEEDRRELANGGVPCSIKPTIECSRIPSTMSAFNPLLKSYTSFAFSPETARIESH